MPAPTAVATIAIKSASFIKKYWYIFAIILLILFILPTIIFATVLNILFPQLEEDDFIYYKSLTEESGINWVSFIAYDVTRLDNYLKENKAEESIFDLVNISFTEYEIVEIEKEITTIVDGKEVTETIIEKEFIVVRDLELKGHGPITQLLKSLDYIIPEEPMTVKSVTDFLETLNEKEEYEIKTHILTDEEITASYDGPHKEWYYALVEILPLLDPSSEFNPDEFIIPDLINNPDIPSIWPTTGFVTSEFGERRLTGTHKGIDIGNNTGTPVYSTADGTIIGVGTSGGFGKRIMIYHGTDENGATYVTVYAHLSAFKASVGANVSQGDLIGGLMGSTGFSTGPHLHYEVRVNGTPLNPKKFLR